VRHATTEALDQLEPLLAQLRLVEGLVEKSRGVFYRKSRAFLHFHEDPSGLFADVRFGQDFERFRVESDAERDALMSRIRTI
jgi:N-acetylglutamate synthase-like GNAT family acetyltransferase